MLEKIRNLFLLDLAIDLGTTNSLVYARDRGIVMQEPSVVAINQKTGQILAIGTEAKKMVGKTPLHIVAIRPLISGVISDFDVTEQMLHYFIEKARPNKFIFNLRPRVIVGIPSGVTEVEKKAVVDATKNAGAREVFLIEEPMASAIGARLPVQEPEGIFIVDIGGGTTEVAVISLGGLVLSKSLRIAGDKLNQDIVQFAEEEYRLLIGPRTAESLKIGIGSAFPLKEKKEMPMRGRNLVTGLPEEILVSDEEIRKATEKSVSQIVTEIKNAVEDTPPELLADIMASGIHLAGGGSLLRGLDILIQKETKIPTKRVEDPMTAVVRGAGMVLENLDNLKDVLAETEYLEPPK
ncbi:MAG: rod shape-determining protein [Patescibacteria group bacterium]|nr:rod shape-determining protein [Patescibacteria group bacterium]MBU1876865.1 rod shape-determining protein [Patescibacteria group bacterium]